MTRADRLAAQHHDGRRLLCSEEVQKGARLELLAAAQAQAGDIAEALKTAVC
ncbi:MAG TPA: hypothetical protein PLE54_09670 [Burkholderiaceae bacterium]|nr:hypothetical protein [Burkholderiaceae bacterium]